MTYHIPAALHSISKRLSLLWLLTSYDVIGRYRGTLLGFAWSAIQPLLILALYTFVFSGIYSLPGSRFEQNGHTVDFAFMIFTGLIVYNFAAEVFTRASSLIAQHPAYVKKIVFPLEILPISSLLTALFHFVVSFLVLLAGLFIFHRPIPATILALPLFLFPLCFMVLGLSWVIAALGVFIRDMSQAITAINMILLFSAPIFYPLSSVPPALQKWVSLNPLTVPVNQMRFILLDHLPFSLSFLTTYNCISFLICIIGFCFFNFLRKGFADAL